MITTPSGLEVGSPNLQGTFGDPGHVSLGSTSFGYFWQIKEKKNTHGIALGGVGRGICLSFFLHVGVKKQIYMGNSREGDHSPSIF